MNDLSSALGDLLPAALGIAISPLPIIASVLMLLSNHPKRAAPAFAVRTWRGRPVEGVETVPPKWMASLDDIGPGAALALGAALSGLNPKNLALAVSGSVAIASADLDTATTVVCVVVFLLLGSTLVAGPVLAYFVATQAMTGPLTSLKAFMQVHNVAIMTVLLTVLGLSNVGKGLGGLLA